MVARRLVRPSLVWRTSLLAVIVASIPACVGVSEDGRLVGWNSKADQPIPLPSVEQMIDDLDRVMTAYGTISVKSPDVWGQDRLSKFQSEYEAEMAEWLKHGFRGDINASVRRSEIEATHLQVGADLGRVSANTATVQTQTDGATLANLSKAQTGLDATLPASQLTPDKTPVTLEPTVVLDEHSNYLNHLNQLRRINGGDDLADRPGYGLYLIRIPVTLSPGPRSRRGKGAIITVSAKPIMTKTTLRYALRNVVINDSVNSLTQAICNEWPGEGDRAPGPGVGAFSLVAHADTELFYGRPNIELLRGEAEHQLAKDLGDAPHHRVARVAEWLRAELEASYSFLEQAATPARSAGTDPIADPLEELGEQVAGRDFERIARIRAGSIEDPQIKRASGTAVLSADELGVRRKKVVSMFAFALRIQAAGVNRRLKQDMIDQDPSLKEILKTLSFFESEVSDNAFSAFEHYVNTKWPLRVYAIEPVIAQQNVADVFGRRKQSALDLVGAGPAGLSRALSAVAAERRAAEDETAIRLNPTMVGFGAGQSTFGWIFYPRLQSSRGRDGRLWTDLALLVNGRVPDPTGNDQSIEPGQRECTALIEMPNFIPKIEFITVADWFRTSEAGEGQKSDLEKASVLGRKLVAANAALNRAKQEGQYRSEEYQIATERLKQLSDLMPTQRMVVRVPSSGDHNDARIFCSQGLQLRPSLMGWHGKPPERGEESTLFVEGRNFSVHDTHVIAGGKSAKAVLISRNLLQVTIAKDASPTPSADGTPLLDINVATPNGVSNHLLINMVHTDPHPAPQSGENTEKPKKDEKSESRQSNPRSGRSGSSESATAGISLTDRSTIDRAEMIPVVRFRLVVFGTVPWRPSFDGLIPPPCAIMGRTTFVGVSTCA